MISGGNFGLSPHFLPPIASWWITNNENWLFPITYLRAYLPAHNLPHSSHFVDSDILSIRLGKRELQHLRYAFQANKGIEFPSIKEIEYFGVP